MSFRISIPVVNWVNFCDENLLSEIKQATRDHKDKFVPTTVSTGEADYRSSLVLWHHHIPTLHDKFVRRIEEVLPAVKQEMGDYAIQHPHTKVEMQMTVHHRNGDHFKTHVDNGSTDTYGRHLTYCYYYRLSEEQNFSGGEMILQMQNGNRTFQPVENSIVFFPSHLYHSVVPTHVPTGKFEDGRHSIIGWIWR